MYRYFPPDKVISPKSCIEEVIPLFDGGITAGAYCVAEIKWNGKKCLGIRWNVNEREWDDPEKKSGLKPCIGEPNSRGYPTWFILPDSFLTSVLQENGELIRIFREASERISERT